MKLKPHNKHNTEAIAHAGTAAKERMHKVQSTAKSKTMCNDLKLKTNSVIMSIITTVCKQFKFLVEPKIKPTQTQ
jgi:hypothetical protein